MIRDFQLWSLKAVFFGAYMLKCNRCGFYPLVKNEVAEPFYVVKINVSEFKDGAVQNWHSLSWLTHLYCSHCLEDFLTMTEQMGDGTCAFSEVFDEGTEE